MLARVYKDWAEYGSTVGNFLAFGDGTAGPYEFALQGHRLADLKKPLEVLRTIHSFDPSMGCAAHILDPDGEPLVEIDVNHFAMD